MQEKTQAPPALRTIIKLRNSFHGKRKVTLQTVPNVAPTQSVSLEDTEDF